ncbi:unnamed protein product [Parascedosporium putredinis]|uniref:ADP-ribosylation factor GTPase-activating protein n=1 Tax=Parascedosporium putredinis TaxID=1442378 RepID=A0A9P1H6N5_9PEZI|nr:unnamed protein product [Parascedosporium putredinis]CAI7998163.1 unnamed protein product [Parascedosporium putredinis]
MGNIASRPDEGGALYLRDQNRLFESYCSAVAAFALPDPEPANGAPDFLLKVVNDDELIFTFTFILRRSPTTPSEAAAQAPDTRINALTYVYASTPKEVENLVTREFNADPNLHRNSNVALVGDYATEGNSSVTFVWKWKWKPPRLSDDRSNGWRNSCSVPHVSEQPFLPDTPVALGITPKPRAVSSQTVDSHISAMDQDEPVSPLAPIYEPGIGGFPPMSLAQAGGPVQPGPPPTVREPVKVDVACPKPTDDVTVADDGPLFRATIKALEQKTGNMRVKLKRVLKQAERAYNAQMEANDALANFTESGFQKRDFEEESKDYYSYVSRYLGQRHDSVKAKKLAESDSKYQTKRRNFELKRFDYSSFMQDLHGGRKEQEVLSHLTKYADAQTQGFLTAARKIDSLLPQLEALSSEVQEADKEYQYQRREREEKRRLLEKSNLSYVEPEPSHSDTELGRADSTGSQWRPANPSPAGPGVSSSAAELSRSPGSLSQATASVAAQNAKFKGIRDLEERDYGQLNSGGRSISQRKEGLLWALSRPGSHVDPRAQLKAGWHKFWIVLDQGKLSEYSNWKQRLDLHMDPIDLRMASVREARNAERRFCFEVITPNFKRVYQATSEEDMNSWIMSINNALQSAVEGRGLREKPEPTTPVVESSGNSFKRDITSILTGKSPHHHHIVPPSTNRTVSSNFEDDPDRLLQMLRDNDKGNNWCADCGSGSKVEWVSINLAIILCIECSGIHRSLGTHISKVRSLTLDITSFTPDIVELLLLVGNRVSNMVWEARLDPSLKPAPQATREQRLKFITAKYVDRAYIEPISPTLSRYGTPDETLLAAIKKNDVQQIFHSVYLALAAADPASPAPATATPGQGSPDRAPEPSYKPVPFPIAELLIQNGAEIPVALPAFPLGRSAAQYIEAKRSRAAGMSGEGLMPHSNSVSLSQEQKLQRDKEARLQKRVSAGGRLAKSPIPEK